MENIKFIFDTINSGWMNTRNLPDLEHWNTIKHSTRTNQIKPNWKKDYHCKNSNRGTNMSLLLDIKFEYICSRFICISFFVLIKGFTSNHPLQENKNKNPDHSTLEGNNLGRKLSILLM